MLLSVIIPFYNNVSALAECLNSFVCEPSALPTAHMSTGIPVATWNGDIQFVVVDDGSDRDESNRARALTGAFGDAATMIVVGHGGAAIARNKGLEAAEGRFVWFVDADDAVVGESLPALLATLRQLDDDVDLLHIGPMVRMKSKGDSIAVSPVKDGVSRSLSLNEIVAPKSSCLDHTTYIISRRTLMEHSEVRYPEGRTILEDSVFMLRLLDIAGCCYAREELSLYLHNVYNPSVTAGAWSKAKCELFMPDIEYFFSELDFFVAKHAELEQGRALYERYRKVYLRVLAVKGCPWSIMKNFATKDNDVGLIIQCAIRTVSLLSRLFKRRF